MAKHIHIHLRGHKIKDADFRSVMNNPKGRALIEQLEDVVSSMEGKNDARLAAIKKNLVDRLKSEFGYTWKDSH